VVDWLRTALLESRLIFAGDCTERACYGVNSSRSSTSQFKHGWIVPTRVKICGISTAEAMASALDAGADDVGLVLFPPSPRHVALEGAAELARQARGRARIVALTVDADDALLAAVVEAVKPDILQLHGSESVERVAQIRRRFGVPVMKAIKVATAEDAAQALDFAEVADLILFDARPPKGADRPGGHGAVFDWQALDGVKDRVHYMLSGGLTAENVAEAIRATGATAVDVSSGVERAPGVKDCDRIRAFLAAVRAADAAVAAQSKLQPRHGSQAQ
jgi:phosphoribosylanthranilate isomerase